MLEDLNRFGTLLMRGSLAVATLIWVLMDEAINRVLFDEDIPAASISVEQVRWSIETDINHHARLPIEVSLRNTSDLRLRSLTTAFSLEDCPQTARLTEVCDPVADFEETTKVDIAAGLRGRYQIYFDIPAAAEPVGAFRLKSKVLKATGQSDPTL